jgi:hypothetical protein
MLKLLQELGINLCKTVLEILQVHYLSKAINNFLQKIYQNELNPFFCVLPSVILALSSRIKFKLRSLVTDGPLALVLKALTYVVAVAKLPPAPLTALCIH